MTIMLFLMILLDFKFGKVFINKSFDIEMVLKFYLNAIIRGRNGMI